MKIRWQLEIDGEILQSGTHTSEAPSLVIKERLVSLVMMQIGNVLSVHALGDELDAPHDWPKFGGRVRTEIIPLALHQRKIAELKAIQERA